MKNKVFSLVLHLILLGGACSGLAQGTAFTYQGRLTDNGAPANSIYDLQFGLYDALANGNPVGGSLNKDDVPVTKGLFTVTLDFGAEAFGGAARWLEIRVRPGDSAGDYTLLSPRQELTPTPYALHAANFTGAVLDAQLSPNIPRLDANQTFTGFVNFNRLLGAPFGVGNSTRVNNLNADLLDGLNSSAFLLKTEHCLRTIAELKAQAAGFVPCVTVLGYYAPGDGGGGNFYWDAEATELDNGGTVLLPDSNPAQGRWKRLVEASLSVKWFGARGDDVSDDTTAFQRATGVINREGGGTLIIPPGRYRVGRQALVNGAWEGESILNIHHCPRPVVIQGCGAVLKATDGLRAGFFSGSRATLYWGMIRLQTNASVTIRDLKLDGNLSNVLIGDAAANGSRESPAYGIFAYNNEMVLIENVHTHHHALDGVVIGYTGLADGDAARPHTLINVVSEYNARQGLSWVGGIGVTALNCKFNHTGRAGFSTSPAAGLDIEAEDSVCRQGLFMSCEFINNVGSGVISDTAVPDRGETVFKKCTFWGTGYYAVFARAPGLVFEGCKIYGSSLASYQGPTVTPQEGTKFLRCHLEDRVSPWTPFRDSAVIVAHGDYVTLEDCVVVANQTRGVYFDAGRGKIIRNTTIIHKHDGLLDTSFQSLIRNCLLENVRFEEAMTTPPANGWYIAGETAVELAGRVSVQGPHVKWVNWSWGLTGDNVGTTRDTSRPSLSLNRGQNSQGPFQGTVKMVSLDQSPAAGAWNAGDIVLNQNPVAGGNVGWVCVTAGNPGVWKTFGAIAP